MKELFQLFMGNLFKIGVGLAIFLCAYLSNMCFSLYNNIALLKEKWSWKKFLNGVAKAVAFLFGISLLCLSVTAIPFFADKVGWLIPAVYAEVFRDLAIVAVIFTVSSRYCFEAFITFKDILGYKEPEVDA